MPPLPAIVEVVGAERPATRLRLAGGSCVLGAGADADVIVHDEAVSRRHVELTLVPEGVAVRDLGSRNGTFYAGQRIEKMVLALGSRIRLGPVEVAITADLRALNEADRAGYDGLLGESPAMRRLFGMLERLEGSLVNVLVQGQSGVGKELVAQALHRGSAVAGGPLVVVNCGAIGRELVLSELFGHRKGAFTGANDDRVGAFEAAQGGTLFLDEVGELPLELQPALLRTLESGEVKRLGENETREVQVRVIAATNRDLQHAHAEGTFREDLYYRLAVVTLTVPPLDERPEDIPRLARHFAREAGTPDLDESIVAKLASRRWPGNARELRNAVLSYLALGWLGDDPAPRASLLAAALAASVDTSQSYQDQKEAFVAEFSRAYLAELMRRTGGNQTEAARIGGLDRSYLGKLMRKYGVAHTESHDG
jgi:DNA-binding NtrC family response regulator